MSVETVHIEITSNQVYNSNYRITKAKQNKNRASVYVCVCVGTYKDNSYILQHIGVEQSVCSVLPVTQHINTWLLLQGQIHVVPECAHITTQLSTQWTKRVSKTMKGNVL